MRKIAALVFALAVSLPMSVSNAQTQSTYPNKPIKFVVPFTPGGSGDIGGRLFAKAIGDRLGQQILIENRGGAGGRQASRPRRLYDALQHLLRGAEPLAL